MTLPETIAVRYTEDEAEYVSLRPVVRQTFQIDELVDMIVSVTGKDAARIVQIMRSGAVAFHGYRYWWNGFEAQENDLEIKLAKFADADPSRAFDFAACVGVVFEAGETVSRHSMEISRDAASRRRFLRLRSFWDDLKALAPVTTPAYREYSYARRADIYMSPLATGDAAKLAIAARRELPRSLATSARNVAGANRILWICPRENSRKSK
jgi:hypothetical protein